MVSFRAFRVFRGQQIEVIGKRAARGAINFVGSFVGSFVEIN